MAPKPSWLWLFFWVHGSAFSNLGILDLKSSKGLWSGDSYFQTRNLGFLSLLASPNFPQLSTGQLPVPRPSQRWSSHWTQRQRLLLAPLDSDITLWAKRHHVADARIVLKSCRNGSPSFYPRDSHEEDESSFPEHHDVKWFNPVHHGLLGNLPISLTHSPEESH